jgi:hypothetical protein
MGVAFKELAKVGMEKWTKEDTEWIYNNSKSDSVEKKVAAWVLKKKFNHQPNESSHHLQ